MESWQPCITIRQPHSQRGGGDEPPILPLGLAVIEAQKNDPSYQAFRLWVSQGKTGPPPHKRVRPSQHPQPLMGQDPPELQWLETLQDEDPEEMRWLGNQDLEMVDLTRRGRPPAGEVLVRVHDPTLPTHEFTRYRIVCPPALRRQVIEQLHTRGHWGINTSGQAIRAHYSCPKMYQQVTQFMTKECWPCIEK